MKNLLILLTLFLASCDSNNCKRTFVIYYQHNDNIDTVQTSTCYNVYVADGQLRTDLGVYNYCGIRKLVEISNE